MKYLSIFRVFTFVFHRIWFDHQQVHHLLLLNFGIDQYLYQYHVKIFHLFDHSDYHLESQLSLMKLMMYWH
jgi:hypothetical protein